MQSHLEVPKIGGRDRWALSEDQDPLDIATLRDLSPSALSISGKRDRTHSPKCPKRPCPCLTRYEEEKKICGRSSDFIPGLRTLLSH